MSEWIKCSDRLPDGSFKLLVKRESGETLKAYFHEDGMVWRCFYGFPIMHWENAETNLPMNDVVEWKHLK